ncbi:MAG TPA: glycosyltransferase [Miltoncostaeaceae bacterium]|nr:glycosyltransferase [Miltoncostaeaceae bacterium]
MTILHQVISSASPADAVTGQALAWRERFRGWGVGGEVIAEHVHPTLARRVVRLDGGGRALLDNGPLLLRYSIWSGAVEAALAAAGPLAVVYHNVTPGDLLREVNPEVADLCDRGRRGLRRLAGRASVLVADSSFNASELAAAGLGDAHVVPLLLELERNDGTAPSHDPERPLVLSVGRIVPSKRLEDAVGAFALFQRERAPGARLVLAGSDDGFERYGQALPRLARDLGARDVRLTGRITDDERDALYRAASAYLCTSVHEGFCAPLVEALAAGVPVVARARAAVPETLGAAGLLIPDDDLAVFAEALHEVVASEPLRATLRARAAARLAELAPTRVDALMHAALAPLLTAA